MLSQCGSAFYELKQRSYSLQRTLGRMKPPSSFNRYHQIVEELYLNTSISPSEIEEHRKCSDALDEAVGVFDVYQTIVELALNMTKSDTFTEAYSYAIQIPPLLKMTKLLFTDEKVKTIDRSVSRECDWLDRIHWTTSNEYSRLREDFGKLDELTSSTDRLFKTMVPLSHNLNNELSHKITIFTRKGQEYLDQRITKSKLSQEFASRLFLKYRENIADLTHELEEAIKEYDEEMSIGMEKLKDHYRKLFELSLPVINNYNVYKLNLVKNAAKINDTTLQNITNGLQNNLEDNMMDLITETYTRLIQPFTEMKISLLDPVDDVIEQINDLSEFLLEYKMSTKMNTNFFM